LEGGKALKAKGVALGKRVQGGELPQERDFWVFSGNFSRDIHTTTGGVPHPKNKNSLGGLNHRKFGAPPQKSPASLPGGPKRECRLPLPLSAPPVLYHPSPNK